jgi:aryl-alcohol dehydrogenase-like predicted oxidoreductase
MKGCTCGCVRRRQADLVRRQFDVGWDRGRMAEVWREALASTTVHPVLRQRLPRREVELTILAELSQRTLTHQDVCRFSDLPYADVMDAVRDLVEDGRIERLGLGKGTWYRLAASAVVPFARVG